MNALIKKAIPWIEQCLYVACPHCDEAILLDSDYHVSKPDKDENMECFRCDHNFIVEGTK